MSEKVQSHILERYQIVKKLGSGAYGHVWKAVDRASKKIVALKKIFDAFQHSTDAQRTYRQIMFLQEFQHDNIIKLLQVIKAQNDKDIYLVFEFMEIDLHSLIREGILKEKHKQFVVYQIAKALKYLHSAELLHRDLKPSNILLNSECLVKVCDFGLVRSVDQSDEDEPLLMTEYVATRWYRAPEILMGSQSYTKGVDIWSFGCLMAQMVKGKPLFAGTSTVDQLEKVVAWTGMPRKSDIEALGSDVGVSMLENLSNVKLKGNHDILKCQDKLAMDLINRMLQFNPNRRITIEQILRHPYLQEFHDSKKQPCCNRVIRPPISDNKRLSLKQYRMLIYKEIGRKNASSYAHKKDMKDLASCEIQCSLQPNSRNIRKKSLRTSTKQSDDQDNYPFQNQYQNQNQPRDSIASKTLYVKSKPRSSYNTPSKLEMYNPQGQSQNKKLQALKTKFLTDVKDVRDTEYCSISKGKAKSTYTSKKHSLKTQGEIFQRISTIVGEEESKEKKRSQSIYSASKRTTQALGKYLKKPVSRMY